MCGCFERQRPFVILAVFASVEAIFSFDLRLDHQNQMSERAANARIWTCK
jgi:hypothetical protein